MSDKVLSAVENVKQELNQFKTKIELRGANKWGSLPQRMRWVVVTLSQAAIFLGTGLLEAFSYILLKSYVVYPLLFYGIILVGLRFAFLELLKLLVKIAIVPVDIINVILKFFDVAVNLAISAIDIVLDVVNLIIRAIRTFDHHLHAHEIQLISWTHIPSITVAEFKRVVGTLVSTCKKFDSFNSIALFLLKLGLHEYTCPVVRSLYPATFLYQFSDDLLGWSYYDGAAPFPNQDHQNCAATGRNNGYDDVCCALGIGYLFLEFFLPVVLLFITLRALSSFLYRAFSLGFYGLAISIELTKNVIVHGINALVEG